MMDVSRAEWRPAGTLAWWGRPWARASHPGRPKIELNELSWGVIELGFDTLGAGKGRSGRSGRWGEDQSIDPTCLRCLGSRIFVNRRQSIRLLLSQVRLERFEKLDGRFVSISMRRSMGGMGCSFSSFSQRSRSLPSPFYVQVL